MCRDGAVFGKVASVVNSEASLATKKSDLKDHLERGKEFQAGLPRLRLATTRCVGLPRSPWSLATTTTGGHRADLGLSE